MDPRDGSDEKVELSEEMCNTKSVGDPLQAIEAEKVIGSQASHRHPDSIPDDWGAAFD
jgi:hypothetical protein